MAPGRLSELRESAMPEEQTPVLQKERIRSDSLPASELSKIVLLNAPQLRRFASNREVTSNYTWLNFVPVKNTLTQ
eukprot:5743546-Pleurochrysis_carterae.AAC.2